MSEFDITIYGTDGNERYLKDLRHVLTPSALHEAVDVEWYTTPAGWFPTLSGGERVPRVARVDLTVSAPNIDVAIITVLSAMARSGIGAISRFDAKEVRT